MRQTRRAMIAGILVCLVAGWVTWLLAHKPVTPNGAIVNIATFSSAVDYAPFYVAKDKGYFDEELKGQNVKLVFSKFEALAPLNDALAAKRLDLVFEAEPPAFIAQASGTSVTISLLSVRLSQNIVARTGSGIRSVADLQNKSVAVLTGTSSHYSLLKSLEAARVPSSKVTVVNLAPPEARAAFRQGAVAAWAVWPPFAQQEELAGTAYEIPGSTATIDSLLVSRTEFARANPLAMAGVLRALARARLFIKADPQGSQALVAKNLDLPVAVVAKSWQSHDFGPTMDHSAIVDLQAKADFLYGNKFISKKISIRDDMLQSTGGIQ